MRRMTMIAALSAVVVAMLATAAYAATAAVYGTNGNDWVDESSGFTDDRIYALGGDDYINAVLTWGAPGDADKLFGGMGYDRLAADDGDGEDLLNGGLGDDECYGTPGDTFANCELITREPLE